MSDVDYWAELSSGRSLTGTAQAAAPDRGGRAETGYPAGRGDAAGPTTRQAATAADGPQRSAGLVRAPAAADNVTANFTAANFTAAPVMTPRTQPGTPRDLAGRASEQRSAASHADGHYVGPQAYPGLDPLTAPAAAGARYPASYGEQTQQFTRYDSYDRADGYSDYDNGDRARSGSAGPGSSGSGSAGAGSAGNRPPSGGPPTDELGLPLHKTFSAAEPAAGFSRVPDSGRQVPAPAYPPSGRPSSGYLTSGYPSAAYRDQAYPEPAYREQGYPEPAYRDQAYPAPGSAYPAGYTDAVSPQYPSRQYPAEPYSTHPYDFDRSGPYSAYPADYPEYGGSAE